MNNKILVIITIWMCIAPFIGLAQEKETILSGIVKDEQDKPFDLATIVLLNARDSVVLKTTFTEADGKFNFSKLSPGLYQIRVSAMGYAIYKSAEIRVSEHVALNLPEIKLIALSKNLNEVSVTAKKAFVERKIDRVVVNVDALISNSGVTAMEVLEKSPGVQVDQNGGVSLKGKQGVVIFIDDKPTHLSGADLENYLKSLPSSALDQIELMTNPPAKYDAAGNAGIINIKTKRGQLRGFNGGINLGLTQGQRTRTINSLNFNIRNSKFNYFGNLSYGYNNSFTDLDINRFYKNEDGSAKSYFNQNSYFNRRGSTYNGSMGADYYQNDNTIWGLKLTGMLRLNHQVNDNTSKLSNPQRVLDSTITAKNVDDANFKNGTVNFNFRHQFDKKGHGITADADYLRYNTKTEQNYYNSSFFANGGLKSRDILSGDLPSNINIYSIKTDYSKPLDDNWKFEAGLKTSYTKTDNSADYFYTVSEVTKPDYNKTNHFIYKENISAAYVNLNKELDRFSFQAGLRVENTISDGHQLGNAMKPDSTFTRNYTSLFPTFYVLYKLDSNANHQLSFNYGRRIERPYYQDLNPFVSPLDKFTYYIGNPFLKPSYVQSFELAHVFKNNYTTTLSYSSSKDNVNETIQILDGTYYSKPANIGKVAVTSLSFNGAFNLAKWLNVNVYSEVTNINSQSDFYTGKLKTSGTYFFINPNARLSLGSGWDGELSGNYRSRLHNVQFVMEEQWLANAAVQKKLGKSTTVKLSVNDIFYTRKAIGTINNLAQTEANWVNISDSRNAVLSLSYRFGKTFSTPPKHEGSGAEAEKNRVRN